MAPSQSKPVIYRRAHWTSSVLQAAGFYNFCAGVSLAAYPTQIHNYYSFVPGSPPLFSRILGIVLSLFGVGYWRAADPQRFMSSRELLLIGWLSKVIVGGFGLYGVFTGQLPMMYLGNVILSDLIWIPPLTKIVWDSYFPASNAGSTNPFGKGPSEDPSGWTEAKRQTSKGRGGGGAYDC